MRGVSEHRLDTVVIGGGQAGLAAGYYLREQGRDFVILDAGSRVGDAWRRRWDSLRLFTPAAYDGLPGLPFPAPRDYYPTKDEMADYLEAYAGRFGLPVRLGRRVELLVRCDGGYLIVAGEERYVAENVVVAAGPYHTTRIPGFAKHLDSSIFQVHSSAYRYPEQLPEGEVLVVGAGNSGAEISVELAAGRRTYLSGRDTGWAPAGLLKSRLFWWLIHCITADTGLGRRGKEFDRKRGTPLIGRPRDIARSGVERVPRVEGVVGGKPELADGCVLEVGSVVWATGFEPDFGWIELPIFDEDGHPIHHRGAVKEAPGLYFVGLPFQHTFASAVVGGVGKDARYIVEHLASQAAKRGHESATAAVG